MSWRSSLLAAVLAGCGAVPPPPSTGGGAVEARDAGAGVADAGAGDGGLELPLVSLDGGVVVWVGAHPDDEFLAAPLLSAWCQRARCVFVVLTRGEGGGCKLPGGCLPDLATVRTLEMQTSTRLFDAGLVQETLANASATPRQARDVWVAQAGGEAALIERVARVLREEGAEILVTFDPLHGSTCHGEHRVAAAVALLAADSVGLPRSQVLLVASQITVESAPMAAGFKAPDGGEASYRYEGDWSRTVEVMQAHASQFRPDEVAAAANAPPRLRTSWFRLADAAAPTDAIDTRYCP